MYGCISNGLSLAAEVCDCPSTLVQKEWLKCFLTEPQQWVLTAARTHSEAVHKYSSLVWALWGFSGAWAGIEGTVHVADTEMFSPGMEEMSNMENSPEQISGIVWNGPLGQILNLDDLKGLFQPS